MLPKQFAQVVGCLITLAIIFIGYNQFSKVARTTKQVAETILEKGREAGLMPENRQDPTDRNELPARDPDRPVNTPVYWQVPRSQSEISIGTFNIQTFGVHKMADVKVMDTLVKVVRQFDCLAIQELRSVDETVIPRFVQMINANGSRYDFVIGPRQGNSSSKEQYVYLYDTYRIELVDRGFVVPDPQNLLHREPIVSRFRTRTPDPRQAFSFSLVNIHTDPDETKYELPALYQVYVWLRQSLRDEDDIILLGDFNEGPAKYGEFWQIPTFVAALPGNVATNTRKTKSYDNILFDGQLTREFTGKSGVLDLEQTFGLTNQQALEVSDHMPVWANFVTHEVRPTQFATQPPAYNQGR